MRGDTTVDKLERFMAGLGRVAREPARIYLTGGSTAIAFGWRERTVDIDLRFEPERDELFRLIDRLKEELDINVELASPPDFIPELPGWQDRCVYITTEGKLSFYHFDLYSQALSKIERGHNQDLKDVDSMFRDGLIEPRKLADLFEAIYGQLYRYPAIRKDRFRRSVAEVLAKQERSE